MKVGDYVRRTGNGESGLAEVGDIGVITKMPHYEDSDPTVRWLTGKRDTNRPARVHMDIGVTLTDEEQIAIMRANLT